MNPFRTAIRYVIADERIEDIREQKQNTLIMNILRIIVKFANFGRKQDYFEIREAYGAVCKEKTH
ncbi:hypothetical protein HMPREF1870_00963 [Bacteroidales bacterium KA00344]|nr:hypothetical protein HMPREF1870_00963 [Bacteroidales bacterium KA00344]